VNGYEPWYKQLKTAMFGESVADSIKRTDDRNFAERIYNSLAVSKGKFKVVGGITPAATPLPTITVETTNLGLGVKTPSLMK
jgi:hypothetical protein